MKDANKNGDKIAKRIKRLRRCAREQGLLIAISEDKKYLLWKNIHDQRIIAKMLIKALKL